MKERSASRMDSRRVSRRGFFNVGGNFIASGAVFTLASGMTGYGLVKEGSMEKEFNRIIDEEEPSLSGEIEKIKDSS